MPLHPFQTNRPGVRGGRHTLIRRAPASLVPCSRFTVYYATEKHFTQDQPPYADAAKGVPMRPVISSRSFRAFSKGEARLVDIIRETDEYTQEFVPGSRLIRSRSSPSTSEGRRRPGQAHCLLAVRGNPDRQRFDLLERLAGDVQAYRLDGGISGYRRPGFVEHISLPSRCSARFRSRPVPGAHRRHRQRLRHPFSGCPPLSAQGSSSPGFPVLRPRRAAFACRGTMLNRLWKIKDSVPQGSDTCAASCLWANRFSGMMALSAWRL